MTMLELATPAGRLPAVWEGNLPGSGVANIRTLGKYAGEIDIDGNGSLKVLGKVSVIDWEDIVGLDEIELASEGLLTQTFSRKVIFANELLIGQRAYYVMVPFRAGMVVTNLHCYVSVVGVTMSFSKMAIYSPALARLGISADQGNAWESLGPKTVPLTAQLTIPTTGIYYVAVLANGATLPTLGRGASALPLPITGITLNTYFTESALADFPATATPATTNTRAIWMGAS